MNVLEVQGLTKRYPAFTLDHVSFAVPQGAVMGFIGRNGAGKSTTLKSILGMVHPDEGAVRVFGMDYAANEAAIRREFYDNWDEEKYRHYLQLFALDESKRVDQLSSGMRVKYMIALALSHSARLLILDEPTSGLDPVSRDELTELLGRIVADGTRSVLFSTHITSDLEKCATHIAFIKDGVMQYSGAIGDFRAQYRDMGDTLEDIIVKVERRPLDESAII